MARHSPAQDGGRPRATSCCRETARCFVSVRSWCRGWTRSLCWSDCPVATVIHVIVIAKVTYLRHFCLNIHRCFRYRAPRYLADCCVPVSEFSGRQHLRSSSLRKLNIPRFRRSTFGTVCKLPQLPVRRMHTVYISSVSQHQLHRILNYMMMGHETCHANGHVNGCVVAPKSVATDLYSWRKQSQLLRDFMWKLTIHTREKRGATDSMNACCFLLSTV